MNTPLVPELRSGIDRYLIISEAVNKYWELHKISRPFTEADMPCDKDGNPRDWAKDWLESLSS